MSVANSRCVSRKSGVTMVEIMVVVVLIGILAALVVPRFNRFTGENQLDGDAQGLYQEIQWMRSQALRTGDQHVMTFGTTTVEGTTRLSWTITRVPASGASSVVRNGNAGITVQLGLPDGISAPGASVSNLFANGVGTSVTDGLGSGISGAAACKENAASSETWVGGIAACGGATSDLETGVLYLRSSRSKTRAYAIAFNRNADLAPRRFRYMGGSWGGN